MTDREPLESKEVRHITFGELMKLSMEEFKKSLGLPSKIVEADPTSTPIATNDKTGTISDQPIEIITKTEEER